MHEWTNTMQTHVTCCASFLRGSWEQPITSSPWCFLTNCPSPPRQCLWQVSREKTQKNIFLIFFSDSPDVTLCFQYMAYMFSHICLWSIGSPISLQLSSWTLGHFFNSKGTDWHRFKTNNKKNNCGCWLL